MKTELLKRFFNRTQKIIIPKKNYDFKVHISICSHRNIDADFMGSLIGFLSCKNPKVQCTSRVGDGLISRARSVEASLFASQTDADILMFIDDDTVFNPLDAAKICIESYKNQIIIGAPIVTKSKTSPFIQSKLFPNQKLRLAVDSNICKIKYLGTGFICIPRKVFQDMIDKEVVPLCYPQKFWPFFMPMTKEVDGEMRFLGEDWAFCERASEIGWECYLDQSIRIKHKGMYAYELDDLKVSEREQFDVINYEEVSQ